MVDALENFELNILDVYVYHKTVGSNSPDEKYNLLAGEGRSGQLSQRSCSDWWLVTPSLDTLTLNIVAERISPSGTF